MKKIMIAAAVVCAAALAQAASINWTTAARFTTNQDGTQINPESVVYLLQKDVTGEKGYDALIAALAAPDFDSSKISSWDCYAGSLTTTSKTASKSAGKGSGTATAKATDAAGEYEQHMFDAILFQKDADGNEYYMLTTQAAKGKAKDPDDPIDSAIDAAFGSSNFGGAWTKLQSSSPEPTPEPTSGLLLLLGVAGLALRRKAK